MLQRFISRTLHPLKLTLSSPTRFAFSHRLPKRDLSCYRSVDECVQRYTQLSAKHLETISKDQLRWNQTMTDNEKLADLMSLSEEQAEIMLRTRVKVTGIDQARKQTFEVQHSLNEPAPVKYCVNEAQLAFPFINFLEAPVHHSLYREVPVIPEYEIAPNVFYIFDLPDNATSQNIRSGLSFGDQIANIQVGRCILGLPAYAKVTLRQSEAPNVQTIYLGKALCDVKTYRNERHLHLHNRQLVIKNVTQPDTNSLILRLSNFGRVIHFERPTFVAKTPTPKDVKNHYKYLQQTKYPPFLLRINNTTPSGTVESQYFPAFKHESSFTVEPTQLILEQRIEYENLCRYPYEINTWTKPQSPFTFQGSEYLLVTYSRPQEAQNAYFQLKDENKVDLLKGRHEFQVDEAFKSELLRFIDNNYREWAKIDQKQSLKASQNTFDTRNLEFFGKAMYDKLQEEILFRKIRSKQKIDRSTPRSAIYFYRDVKDLEKQIAIVRKSVGVNDKSFDELAEHALYGQALPKNRPEIDLPVESDERAKVKELQQFIKNQPNVKSVSELFEKFKVQGSQQSKYYSGFSNKRAVPPATTEDESVPEGQVEEATEEVANETNETGKVGKKQFSTARPQPTTRLHTEAEKGIQQVEYARFIRTTINEYLGIFTSERLKLSSQINPLSTFINPDGITFTDGTPFLTEDDLTQAFRQTRCLQDAVLANNTAFELNQIYKSGSMDWRAEREEMIKHPGAAQLQLADAGFVAQTFPVPKGQNAEKIVLEYNALHAQHSEEYRVVTRKEDGEKFITKVIRREPTHPVDKFATIDKFLAGIAKTNPKGHNLLQQHARKMAQTGEVLTEVKEAFGLERTVELDDLLLVAARQLGIYRKDIQSYMSRHLFSRAHIEYDIKVQAQIEAERQRATKPKDFAKDPYNVRVKDRQGFYVVSKYRQI